MEKISIVIPSYNRFKYLLNTITSIKEQTHKNIEIIVVNDCSTQKDYYEYEWNDIIIIHLPKNTREIYGYVCAAHVRNVGIKISTGKYVAFCDDDDIWFPNKLELQLNAMKNTNCKMSCTDGLIGSGPYNKNTKYEKYNAEHHFNTLKNIYSNAGSNLLNNEFPDIWDSNFLKIHNCMICSSVIIEKDVLDKINNFKNIKPPGEDYDCWLRALKHCNSAYIKDICFYYDANHGDGQNY